MVNKEKTEEEYMTLRMGSNKFECKRDEKNLSIEFKGSSLEEGLKGMNENGSIFVKGNHFGIMRSVVREWPSEKVYYPSDSEETQEFKLDSVSYSKKEYGQETRGFLSGKEFLEFGSPKYIKLNIKRTYTPIK